MFQRFSEVLRLCAATTSQQLSIMQQSVAYQETARNLKELKNESQKRPLLTAGSLCLSGLALLVLYGRWKASQMIVKRAKTRNLSLEEEITERKGQILSIVKLLEDGNKVEHFLDGDTSSSSSVQQKDLLALLQHPTSLPCGIVDLDALKYNVDAMVMTTAGQKSSARGGEGKTIAKRSEKVPKTSEMLLSNEPSSSSSSTMMMNSASELFRVLPVAERKKIRLHTKSVRSPDLMKLIIQRIPSEQFAGLMSISPQETLQLLKLMVPDGSSKKRKKNKNSDDVNTGTRSSDGEPLAHLIPWCHKAGVRHILVAYPVADEGSSATMVQAMELGDQLGVRVAAMVDSLYQVKMLSDASAALRTVRKKGLTNATGETDSTSLPKGVDCIPNVHLWLDIDMGWRPLGVSSEAVHVGTWRSPLRTKEHVMAIVEEIHHLNRASWGSDGGLSGNSSTGRRSPAPPGVGAAASAVLVPPSRPSKLLIEGIMGYEAHIAGVADFPASPSGQLMSGLSLFGRLEAWIRRNLVKWRSIPTAACRRLEIVRMLRSYWRMHIDSLAGSAAAPASRAGVGVTSTSHRGGSVRSDFFSLPFNGESSRETATVSPGGSPQAATHSSRKLRYSEIQQPTLALQCNGGGSGSLVSTCADPSVTEVTIGSGALCGHLFDNYVDLASKPCLFFALGITRAPGSNIVTCNGGGWMASGPAQQDRLPLCVHPEGAEYLPMEGAGEVQTPLKLKQKHPTKDLVGRVALFRPTKSGELGEIFPRYLLVGGTGMSNPASPMMMSPPPPPKPLKTEGKENDDDLPCRQKLVCGEALTYRGYGINVWSD